MVLDVVISITRVVTIRTAIAIVVEMFTVMPLEVLFYRKTFALILNQRAESAFELAVEGSALVFDVDRLYRIARINDKLRIGIFGEH